MDGVGEGGSEAEEKNLLQEDSSVFLPEEGVIRHRKTSSSRFNFSTAGKMLRKKIPQSGLLMLPRRLWMQTVPTKDCEVILLFSTNCEEATVNWLVTRLKTRFPDLILMIKNHLSKNSFALYVTATMDGLVKGAEDLHLSKKTKTDYGNGLREINHDELHMLQGIEDPSTFFSSQERQMIVLHLLNSLRGIDGDQVAGINFRIGQAIVPKLRTDGVIQQILPLHDHKQLAKLRTTWVQSFFSFQPIDLIQEYFGPKIGIYFSWLGFYTASLIVPGAIGLIFWIYFWGKDQAQEDKAFVFIAFLNVVWGSMWLEAWKRRSAELTHRWGLHDHSHELLLDPRPEFEGDLETSPVTNRIEPSYPSWKRNVFRYLITLPVVSSCLGFVFVAMFIVLQFQDWIDDLIERRGLPALISYGPKFVMAVMISVFDEGYSKIATWLNNMENYRHEETYQNHLIIKLTVFRLVNSFLVLFYIAFYLQDMESLKAQLAVIFLTRQIIGNVKESCIPYFLEQMKLARLSFDLYGNITPNSEKDKWDGEKKDGTIEEETEKAEENDRETVPLSRHTSKSRIVGQAEIECNMAKYKDTFEDYLEMFIQFGYVMLFSSAFPLAAACAFANNLLEIRSDAFKLCCVFQRPFGQTVRSIGVWQDAMELMCLLGIMVNCMLIGLSGQVHRMFPEMSTTQTILFIIVLEHIMIALKYGISYVIPDEPEWIIRKMAKVEFQRREVLKNLSTSTREGSALSSPKSCPISNVSSLEYIERSAQTSFESEKDSPENKFSTDEIPKKSTNLGRSVSAGDKAKHCVPSSSKRWNQHHKNFWEHSKFSPGSSDIPLGAAPSESLPVLSSKFEIEKVKSNLNFSPTEAESPLLLRRNNDDYEQYYPEDQGSRASSISRSSDSMTGSSTTTTTVREELFISTSAPKEVTRPSPIITTESEDRRLSFPIQKHKRNFPSNESLSESGQFKGRRLEPFRFTSIPEIPKWKSRHHRTIAAIGKQESKRESSSSDSGPVWQQSGKSSEDSSRKGSGIGGAEASIMSKQLDYEKMEKTNNEVEPYINKPSEAPPKIGKRHPVKFLKRAQSFSQVFSTFKKSQQTLEKKKRHIESIRDDYSLAINREPMGELALIPLEKLVSIDTIRTRRSMTIDEEP